MITLFRKIRQRLVASGSVTKYLLYAIGEILLVVIGILLALQINNWNEEAKTRQAISSALSEVVQDLRSDSLEYSKEIIKRQEDLDAQRRMISFLDSDQDRYDSVYVDLGHVMLKRNTSLLNNGYDLLNDIGISKLEDRELREQLVNYYEVTIEAVNNEIADDKFEFEQNWLPYVRSHFSDWEFGKVAYPNEDEEVFNDPYFLSSLRINLYNLEGTLESHRIALTQAASLAAMIRMKMEGEGSIADHEDP